MKVLVTGGCGFIGSHTCEYYIRKGDEVVSFDNMTKHELTRTQYATDACRDYNWEFLKGLGVTMVQADIRDTAELMKSAAGCDYIVHTAAQPAMTISWEDPALDMSTNVLGTFNVLEVARKLRLPVVNCATIHVYGNDIINKTLKETDTRYVREPAAIDEEAPTMKGTLTPLHASKSAAESYVQAYIDTYGLEAASFRLTGLYGPRQFGGEDHGWIALFIIRALLGIPINIYGTGKQLRDPLYATDVAESFDAFYRTRRPGIYNIGGGVAHSLSLLECIKLIEETIDREVAVDFKPSRLGDLQYFICDATKAKRELGWEPRIPPREGVRKLIDWVNENRSLFQKTTRNEAEIHHA